MDDTAHGTRNAKGHWAPNERPDIAPIWAFPPRLRAVLRWLPSYFAPYNLLFMGSAILWFLYVAPSAEQAATLTWDWPLRLLIVNAVAVFLWYGAWDLHFYVRRAQGTRLKYNPAFPADRRVPAFLFRSQTLDGMIRTFATGVPIWTAWQVGALWAWGNGWGMWTTFADSPVWLIVFTLILPAVHELHFYLVHRLIHLPWLYRRVHSVHHKAVNPSPWSSLSMHWAEHLMYFSGAALHLIIPSHPALMTFQLHQAGFGAVVGHIGFHKLEIGEDRAVDTHAYVHYLHHKLFEVNYADGLMPLDKWFGTFHDGGAEADERLRARRMRG